MSVSVLYLHSASGVRHAFAFLETQWARQVRKETLL